MEFTHAQISVIIIDVPMPETSERREEIQEQLDGWAI